MKANETIKRENDAVEEQDLNKTASNVNNSQEAVLFIHRYKYIIKTQNKKAIGHIGNQGQLLKEFKDTEHFFDNVAQRNSTIFFKILLYKFLKKYPLPKKSTVQSGYFKNNFKAIKVVCKENPTFSVSITEFVLMFLYILISFNISWR